MAQERFGIAHSNYAGNDATYLNPARSAGQWPYADIRLAGLDLYAWNSLVAWSSREQRLVGEVRSGIAGSTGGEVIMRSATSGAHRGFVQANVLGPAFSLSLGRGTIGAGVRMRTYTSATGISSAMGNFIFHGLGYRPQHGIRYQEEGVRVLTAAWTEFAVNYAHILKAEGFGLFSAGINAHYNLGHAGGALQFETLDYTVIDSARLVVHEATARYGFAMPAMSAGYGWGADLGVTYERTLEEADGYMPHRASGGCDPLRYRYRIGLSLLDLGGLRFRQGQAGSISTGTASISDYTNIPVNEESDLDSLLSTATNWDREESFSIGTPTALALQYDQRVANNTYVALVAVQNVSFQNSTRLRRTNSVSITPRFETRYVEAALPITLHEYDLRRPSVGFMLRFEGLVVGTDHIFPFINTRDVYAADIYFRLRWMIHRSPFCKGKRSGAHHTGGKDSLPCATPND
ncbi:MAG: hypothetical protein IPG92_08740 [Flavobacteriales bacterium]|nr:hypothetical protein [Flavobacteriales bacterium]